MRPHLGKLRPIWAVCTKSGQKCSRIGGGNSPYWYRPSLRLPGLSSNQVRVDSVSCYLAATWTCNSSLRTESNPSLLSERFPTQKVDDQAIIVAQYCCLPLKMRETRVRTLPLESSGHVTIRLMSRVPTLPNANLRYQAALDWRRWTMGGCRGRFPLFFVCAVLIEQTQVFSELVTGF